MKFGLDASVEYALARRLQNPGHDVAAVGHGYERSLSDPAVLAIALDEGRVLLTNDLDFGTLVFQHGHRHSGVILYRPSPGDVDS